MMNASKHGISEHLGWQKFAPSACTPTFNIAMASITCSNGEAWTPWNLWSPSPMCSLQSFVLSMFVLLLLRPLLQFTCNYMMWRLMFVWGAPQCMSSTKFVSNAFVPTSNIVAMAVMEWIMLRLIHVCSYDDISELPGWLCSKCIRHSYAPSEVLL